MLVVYAHPCPESFAAAVRARVVAGLDAAGHGVRLLDLYDDLHGGAYDPGLALPERHRHALSEAEALVLVHPTWWTSQPAILLAWLGQAVTHGLGGVRTVVTVTTHGGSRVANRVAGESGRRVVERAVRPRCADGAVHRRLALYGLDRSSERRRRVFLDRVERRVPELVAR